MSNLRRILFLLFFLSGFSALVYEVVWARQLSLIFGTTSFAISSILAVFFAGLALGSYLFGRLIDKGGSALKTYALLELGIGFYAFFTPWIFKLIESVQVSFWQRFSATGGPTFSGFSLFTFSLCFLSLIIPTTLMGGTLPVLSKFWVRGEEEIGSGVGALYFINTLGATIGAFLAGFFLIATVGVNETILIAAVINLLIGTVVLGLARNKLRHSGVADFNPRHAESARLGVNQRILLIAFALMGFAALSLEVLWTRILILFYGGSVYAFTTVLVTFLLGIALGSAIASKILDRYLSKNLFRWFGICGVVLGVLIVASLPLFNQMPFWLLEILKEARGSFGTVTFWEFGLAFLIMFLPTLLMGIIFPLGVKIYTQEIRYLGGSVGGLYAANTLGGIIGSLVAGFLLISLIGTQKGIWLAATLYLLVGGAILITTGISKKTQILISCFIFLLILTGYFLPSWNKHFLISGPFANWRFFVSDSQKQAEKRMESSQFLYYKEGVEATVAVKKSGEQVFLRINGKTDAATGLDMDTQILSGQLPMLLHPNPEDVLVIGLGSGITLGSVQQHPLTTVVAVEIEPAVVEAAKYFSQANYNALEDKRLKMVVGDGRNYLLALRQAQGKQYDVITSEPSNVWLSGNSKLFTKEYFQLARGRLKEGGLFAHWIQLYNLSPEDLKIAIKTFQSVFPYTSVWDNLSSYDLLLIGSLKPQNYDLSLLEEKFKEQKIKDDLARIFIDNPTQLFSYLVLDSQGVTKWTEKSKENTDNHPLLEFSAPKSLFQATISQNLEELKDWRPDLFPEDRLWQKYSQARNKITLGKMFFTRGENQKAIVQFEEALKIDPDSKWLKLQLGKEN